MREFLWDSEVSLIATASTVPAASRLWKPEGFDVMETPPISGNDAANRPPRVFAAPGISILERLKAETRAAHDSIENRIDLSSIARDAESYLSALKMFWGFFQPLESALSKVAGLPEVLPDYASRPRAGLLEKDLAAMGFDRLAGHGLPVCGALPFCGNVAQALGCMYVLEGSTLGGQMIARRVRECGGVPAHACGFFLSHGDKVGSMWKTFGAAVEGYAAENPGESSAICQAARQTFGCLEAWSRDSA